MAVVKAIEGGYDQFIEGGEPAGNFHPDVTVWSAWGVRSALHRMNKKFSGIEELEALRAENAELKRELKRKLAQGGNDGERTARMLARRINQVLDFTK